MLKDGRCRAKFPHSGAQTCSLPLPPLLYSSDGIENILVNIIDKTMVICGTGPATQTSRLLDGSVLTPFKRLH